MSGVAAQVNTPSQAHMAMSPAWGRIDDICGGTERMRLARDRYLPMFPRESEASYSLRLCQTFLHNATRDAIEKVVASAFCQPIEVTGEIPALFGDIEADADGSGRTLNAFAMDVFRSAVTKGLCHILVDTPDMVGMSRGQQRRAGHAVRLIEIPADDLLGHRYGRDASGKQVLTQIRYSERRMESDGQYGECERHYVRVINTPIGAPATYELHRSTEAMRSDTTARFEMVEEGPYRFNKIPLVTLYTRRTGPMSAALPFEDLVWLNIEHWQRKSSHAQAVTSAEFSWTLLTGIEARDLPDTIGMGAGAILAIGNKGREVKAQVIEQSGGAIEVGHTYLRKIEEEMQVQGLRPHVETATTATAEAINSVRQETLAQSWCTSLEVALGQAFKCAAEMTGEVLDDDFQITVNKEDALRSLSNDDINFLLRLRETMPRPAISREALIEEAKRRGILRAEYDADEDAKRIEREMSELDGGDPDNAREGLDRAA